MDVRKKTILYNTNVKNKLADPINLDNGELAVNINSESPFIMIKNDKGTIEKFGSMASTTGDSEFKTMTQKSITSEFKLPSTYIDAEYPTIPQVTFKKNNVGDVMSTAINNVDINVSTLAKETVKYNNVSSSSISKIKTSCGFNENLEIGDSFANTSMSASTSIIDAVIKSNNDLLSKINNSGSSTLPNDYVKVDYPKLDTVTFEETTSGVTIPNAIHNVDSNVATLIDEVIKDEEAISKSFSTIKISCGFNDNFGYEPNSKNPYIEGAGSLSDAIDIASTMLKNDIDNLAAQPPSDEMMNLIYNSTANVHGNRGYADWKGLKEIGWSDKDVFDFKQHGVNWNTDAEDVANAVPQTDKDLVPMDKSKIASAQGTLKYCPMMDTSKETYTSCMFSGCTSLTSVPQFDTSGVTNMSEMFYRCSGLTSVPRFDTSKVTNMRSMFSFCTSLTSVPKFDTSNVTDMYNMFEHCTSLTSVPRFDTSNVTDMWRMFWNCKKLTSVPLFDTYHVTNMSDMFFGCSGLTSVPLLHTYEVTDMEGMFSFCTSLTTVPLFDTFNVTNMVRMFQNCHSLISVPRLNTHYVTNMMEMFDCCISLKDAPLFDTMMVTNMNSMFNNCSSLITVSLLNTSIVTDMFQMFRKCESLTSVPLFDTSRVTNMCLMFSECKSLTTVPLFDTSKVTNMGAMFDGCKSLTTVPLFDTSKVTNTSAMFSGCTSLTTLPLFDTNNVTDMCLMFSECKSLTTVPLFNTSKVTNTSDMFNGCSGLTSVPKFDTSKVTNMRSMFELCTSLTSVPQFDTSNVTDMYGMFRVCNKLTTVPEFDTSNVTDMRYAFDTCSNLTDLGGLKGLKCDLILFYSNLTHDSIMNVINKASDVKSAPKTLTLGNTNLNKLTPEEKKIATDKGWTLQ